MNEPPHQSRWLLWARRLQALGATGLHFGDSEFDKERYQEVVDIAAAMLADLADVPVERISELLASDATNYATPLIDVRGALIRGGEMLLVQEKQDGRWTMPGGYADVGLSAAENIVKEVYEEAGIEVRASHLYCVRHKTKHAYRPDLRDFYKFFFLLEPTTQQAPSPGLETADARYFALQDTPPLSTGRVIEKDLVMAFEAAATPGWTTVFD